jgi:23S rRNA (adenine2503-C2)-methyltransferase
MNRRGILTRLRQSAGQAVDGGCGQLRARLLGDRPAADADSSCVG